MKKYLTILFFLTILTSCGPHRMQCGPGRRCLVENQKKISASFVQKATSIFDVKTFFKTDIQYNKS